MASNAHDLTLSFALMCKGGNLLNQSPSIGLSSIKPECEEYYSLKDVKMGVYWEYFKDCDPEISEMCSNVVHQIYKDFYHGEIVDITIPLLGLTRTTHMITIVSEMRSYLNDEYLQFSDSFLNESRVTLGMGNSMTSTQYIQAQRARTHVMDLMEELFQKVDVIITPTIAITAPEILDDVPGNGDYHSGHVMNIMKYMTLMNVTGLPSITIPVGYSKNKLPIGIQIISRWWNESELIKFAYLTERRIKREKPDLFYSSF
jgi:Asp-tRNA(Asn)/Glu-tRNA(Gln) amidotransferase A subunit family amidase